MQAYGIYDKRSGTPHDTDLDLRATFNWKKGHRTGKSKRFDRKTNKQMKTRARRSAARECSGNE